MRDARWQLPEFLRRLRRPPVCRQPDTAIVAAPQQRRQPVTQIDSSPLVSLPSPATLRALGERVQHGMLVFNGRFEVSIANGLVRELFGVDMAGSAGLARELEGMLPPFALPQARETGRWSGSLPIGDRVITVHLHHHSEEGNEDFLALFQHIDGPEDYERELQQRHAELRQAYLRLNGTQEKLLQSEKMASIGQLAAGVAHEINNPIGYVHSNLGSLQEYLRSLFTVIEAYERALRAPDPKALIAEIDDIRDRLDIDFISRDLPQLMAESREGIERVTRIVRDLKDFSYSGRDESWKLVDLHAGLESTINIIWNELKYKVTLERRYGELPMIECLPSELNQVYMNLLLNAGHAIADRGNITVSTGVEGDDVWVEFQDDGAGISPELRQRIFDPFFTTKPVGSGTGLGLSISYGIINKHHGRIDLDSTMGEGSRFRVVLPIRQPK